MGLASLLFFATTIVRAASPGSTTADFLNMGVGARADAMGQAFTAAADDASSAYWNPAGLARVERPEVLLMHTEHVEGVRYEYAGFAAPIGLRTTIGAHASYLTAGDIAGFDAAGTPLGSVAKSYDGSFGVSAARALNWGEHKLWVGAGAEGVRKVVAGEAGSVVSSDLGLIYRAPDARLPDVGVSLLHWGPALSVGGRSAPLPRTLRIGVARSWTLFDNPLRVAADGIFSSDNPDAAAFGIEYLLSGLVSIRVGYQYPFDVGNGLRFGLGIGGRDLAMDYALVPFGSFGYVHKMALTVKFGRRRSATALETDVDRELASARRAFQHGDLFAAYAQTQKILALVPVQPDAALLKRRIQERYEALDRDRQIAIAGEQLARAKAARTAGNLIEATGYLNHIMGLDPGNEEAKAELAAINGQFARARREQAIMAVKRGAEFIDNGQYLDAIDAYRQALSLEKDNEVATKGLQEAQKRLEGTLAARHALEQQVRVRKIYERALTAYEHHDDPEAFDALIGLLTQMPTYSQAQALLAQVRFRYGPTLEREAREHLTSGNIDEAVSKLRRAVAVEPQNEEYRKSLAAAEKTLLFKNQKLSEGLNGEGFKAYQDGDLPKALRLWREASTLDPKNEKLTEQIATAAKELEQSKR